MFKNIMLAASPQVRNEAAPKAAFSIARRCGSNVVIFHAIPMFRNSWASQTGLIPEEQLVSAVSENIAKHFAEDINTLPGCSVSVTVQPLVQQALAVACAKNVELIVVGERGGGSEGNLREWTAAGSTVTKLSDEAPCPILVVTRETDLSKGFGRILVGADFSTPAENALRYAVTLAKECGARIDLFHVLDVGPGHPNPEYFQSDMEACATMTKERMERKFGHLLKGVEHAYASWEGIPSVEILKYARWNGVDLIVMSHHSSVKDQGRLLIGSTAAQVAFAPGCPTLLVNYQARPCA